MKYIDNFLFDYGIDIKNRRIFYGYDTSSDTHTDINSLNVNNLVKAIKKLEAINPHKPIELYLNSFGGSIYDALYVIDIILSSSCQFIFIGGGAIMSAATLIMAVCDERWLFANATVMIHNGFDDDGVINVDDKVISVKESLRLCELMYNIYADNSKMPITFWRKIAARDTYLTPQQALTLGLIDGIIEPKKRGNLRKFRQYQLKQYSVRDIRRTINQIFKNIGINETLNKLEIKIAEDEYDDNIDIKTDSPDNYDDVLLNNIDFNKEES